MFISSWRKSCPRAFRKCPRCKGYQPRVELLENRLAPAIIMVTTTADDNTPNDSSVSMREAIQAINNGSAGGDTDITNQTPGTFGSNDTIDFKIAEPASGSVVQTINLGSTGNGALPAITKPVTIDGYSESGASPNTLANGDNAKIFIELNGANAGANASGLTVGIGAVGSTIKGLAINRFSARGILLQTTGNTIAGNFIGTNPAGTVAEPNQGDGVQIAIASNNTIGGTTPDARNVLSGNNLDGIHIVGTLALPATGNVVQGNFVGINSAGTGSVGLRPGGSSAGTSAGNFEFGIEISGGNSNTIGGTTAAARNVVGFNLDGIEIDNGGENNIVQANFSGVGADGTTPVGNVLHGIALRGDDNLAPPLGPGQANEPAVSGNLIGGMAASGSSPGNLIEFNGSGGVAVFGNPPQNNAALAQNSGNTIEGNSIFENGRSSPTSLIGIDLTNQFVYPKDDGVTGNDKGQNLSGSAAPHKDPSNPNNFQNFPVLTSATQVSGGVQVAGTLTQSVSAMTTFRIEFFASNPDPAGGIPEGQTFIGATSVTTDASGKASFSITLMATVSPGQFITATATNTSADPSSPTGSVNLGNTSEFSAGVQIPNLVPTLTSVSPGLTTEGGGALTITVNGSNFVSNSTVDVNGSALATTFLSSTKLRATIAATFTADEAALVITVVNPAPGGGASNAVQLQVLEVLFADGTRGTGNQRFVAEVYHDLLKRPVDASGLATWSGQLDQGVSPSQVVTSIESSTEYRTDQVQAVYNQYLHRAADPSGLSSAINLLNSGGTVERLAAIITGSPEYFQNRGGGSNDGFLNAFYADALNRQVDASGRASWDQALASGANTTQVALGILSSNEYRTDLVRAYYPQFLDRAVDSSGLATYVNALNNGMRDEAIIAALIGSTEFFGKTAN